MAKKKVQNMPRCWCWPLMKMFELREDREAYAAQVRERMGMLDELMQRDERDFGEHVDHAWEKVKMPDE